MTTNNLFTGTQPKRSDIVGDSQQAFGHGTDLRAHIINTIKARIVAAIGTIAHDGTLQYLFAPSLYYDLAGNPVSIIGNSSNTLGEFNMVMLNLDMIKFSLCILDKSSTFSVLPVGEDLTDTLLADTPYYGKGPAF